MISFGLLRNGQTVEELRFDRSCSDGSRFGSLDFSQGPLVRVLVLGYR